MARRRGRPRGDRLAHVPRRRLAEDRRRCARSGPAGLGARRRGGVARSPDLRGDAGPRHRGGRRRRFPAHSRRADPRATRGARDLRVPADRPLDPPLRRPGLRLRARDGAALGGAARRGRLEEPPGRGRLRQPVPLLPADERRPHPLGRLRRRLQLPQRPGAASRPAAGDLRDAGPELLRHLPAAGGNHGSRTGGAVPSTRAAASA